MTKLLLYLTIWLTLSSFVFSEDETKVQQIFYEKGKADAKAELKKGILAQETYGLPAEWSGEYFQILKEKYGVDLRGVAGCIVSTEITAHAEGFNEIMDAAIKAKFGQDIFDKAAATAELLYEKKAVLSETIFYQVQFTEVTLEDALNYINGQAKKLKPKNIKSDYQLDTKVSQKTLQKTFNLNAENISLEDLLKQVAAKCNCEITTPDGIPVLRDKAQ